MNNAYKKYMEQSVMTMSPSQAIIALYEKAALECNKAIYYIENKDIPKATNSIYKVQDIVAGLDSILKTDYEVGENLAKLYDFFMDQLIKANVEKNTEILKKLAEYFNDLKESFIQITRKGVSYGK